MVQRQLESIVPAVDLSLVSHRLTYAVRQRIGFAERSLQQVVAVIAFAAVVVVVVAVVKAVVVVVGVGVAAACVAVIVAVVGVGVGGGGGIVAVSSDAVCTGGGEGDGVLGRAFLRWPLWLLVLTSSSEWSWLLLHLVLRWLFLLLMFKT